MSVEAHMPPNDPIRLRQQAAAGRLTWAAPIAMLFSRLLLFAFWQAAIALGLWLAGSAAPWEASIAWWPIVAILTNLTGISLLAWRFRREDVPLIDLYRPRRRTVKGDLLVLLGVLVVSGPVGFLPNTFTAAWLWGDPMVPVNMMIRALPLWAAVLSLAFPLTIALAELPTYFGYVMPRLEALSGHRALAVGLPVLLLAAQHVTLPLILDGRFILWRFVMFLPFAVLLGVALRWRPTLLPYLIVVHGILDLFLALQILGATH